MSVNAAHDERRWPCVSKRGRLFEAVVPSKQMFYVVPESVLVAERQAREDADAEVERLKLIQHDNAVRLEDRRQIIDDHEQRIREDYKTITALTAERDRYEAALREIAKMSPRTFGVRHTGKHPFEIARAALYPDQEGGA